jgi:hypothetical protein
MNGVLMMRKWSSACLFLLLAAGGERRRAAQEALAVFDFDYGAVRSYTAGLFGTDVDVGRGIADLLVKELVRDSTYSVIERKALAKILAEQNFSNSDRADATSAAKIGKLLGVDAIIIGSITQFGGETKQQKVGGGSGTWGGFGVGGVGLGDQAIVTGCPYGGHRHRGDSGGSRRQGRSSAPGLHCWRRRSPAAGRARWISPPAISGDHSGRGHQGGRHPDVQSNHFSNDKLRVRQVIVRPWWPTFPATPSSSTSEPSRASRSVTNFVERVTWKSATRHRQRSSAHDRQAGRD